MNKVCLFKVADRQLYDLIPLCVDNRSLILVQRVFFRQGGVALFFQFIELPLFDRDQVWHRDYLNSLQWVLTQDVLRSNFKEKGAPE